MDGNPEPKPVRPSEALMGLMMAAGRGRILAQAREGIDLTEEVSKTSVESIDILRTFISRHPETAQEFFQRSGIERTSFDRVLEREWSPEPQPPPPQLRDDATDERRKLYETLKRMDDKRRANGEAAAFSGPVRAALKAAKTTAPEGAERFNVGAFIAALFETESNAQAAFLKVASPERGSKALDWLRRQPDPSGAGLTTMLDEIKSHSRDLMDAVWPSIQAKTEATFGDSWRQIKDDQYAKNPALYEEPLDVAKRLAQPNPLPPDRDYMWRSGVLLHAAANEARIRRAPEVTLDHLLVALLRDGADTADFLDARNVDPAEWSRRLDTVLPRYEEGPRWPPDARNLSIPTNYDYRQKPPPDGKKREEMTEEERLALIERVVDTEIRFTDLRFLADVPNEPKTVAYALFAEAGVTEDELKAEIFSREKGDRDWWRKPPDLVGRLRALEGGLRGEAYERSQVCLDAAQYEARMRGAPAAEFDDLLVALLVPGTDVWTALQALGNDPQALRGEIDALRPRLERKTMFPDAHAFHPRGMFAKKGFSDLLLLRPLASEDVSLGLRLLQERGLTPEVVAARLAELGVETFRA